jgi:hypothetical protein
MCVCKFVLACTYMCGRVFVSKMCGCVFVSVCWHKNTCAHTYIHAYVCICMCMYVYVWYGVNRAMRSSLYYNHTHTHTPFTWCSHIDYFFIQNTYTHIRIHTHSPSRGPRIHTYRHDTHACTHIYVLHITHYFTFLRIPEHRMRSYMRHLCVRVPQLQHTLVEASPHMCCWLSNHPDIFRQTVCVRMCMCMYGQIFLGNCMCVCARARRLYVCMRVIVCLCVCVFYMYGGKFPSELCVCAHVSIVCMARYSPANCVCACAYAYACACACACVNYTYACVICVSACAHGWIDWGKHL